MTTSSGLTLIEVLIAIFVLTVGVIAASSLQAGALRSTSQARTIQAVTNTARSEIELQRQLRRGGELPAPATPGCSSSAIPTGHTCTVTVTPCRIVSGALSCSTAGSGAVIADRVTVRVVGPRSTTVELVTVVAR